MTIALDEKQYEEDLKYAYQKGWDDAKFTDYDTLFVNEFIQESIGLYSPKQPDTSMHEMD